MSDVRIRPASPDDADGMNRVYNPFIRDSIATFETTELTLNDRRAWLAERAGSKRHPVFVATDGEGKVLGFANASAFDPRPGYATSVKTSVFIEPASQGRGLARRLYEALLGTLAETDLHRAYALIVPPNPASVALHRAFGFRHLSTLSEVGRKFGRFHDVMWFEKAF